MAENKLKMSWKFYFGELCVLILGIVGTSLLGTIKNQNTECILGNCVSLLLCLAAGFLFYRKAFYNEELDYDNGAHQFRFLVCIILGIILGFICSFLPAAGWPFLLIYILTSLFSCMNVGIIFSSTILMIPVFLSNGTINDFFLYFISGTIGIVLFHRMGKEFKIGYAFFLSLFCLLVCETANVVVIANARPDIELFVIPVANVIISGILLLGSLKLFAELVLFKYRSIYLDINDTENEVLKEWRNKNKESYMASVHITYFCSRIGDRLQLDPDGLKCAALYFELYSGENISDFQNRFPPNAIAILSEYRNRRNGIRKKETAVLICSELMINSILFVQEKTDKKELDYEKIVDTVFQKILLDDCLKECEITMYEIDEMKRIFKEEKLYYDFLR